MKQHFTKVCLTISGLVLTIPLVLHAAPPTQKPEGGCGGLSHFMGKHGPFDAEHLPRHLKELTLTDEQRAKIGEALKTQGQSMREQFEAGRKAHDELRALSLSAEYTEEKAKTLSEQGAKTMAEASLMHSRMDHAIYQLLTPEQQQQWKEKRESFKARHGRWSGAGVHPQAE